MPFFLIVKCLPGRGQGFEILPYVLLIGRGGIGPLECAAAPAGSRPYVFEVAMDHLHNQGVGDFLFNFMVGESAL